MTEQEYMRRRTIEHTNLIARRCLYCGRLKARFSA